MVTSVSHYGSYSNPMGRMEVPRHHVPSYPMPVHDEWKAYWPLWVTVRDFFDGEYAVKGQREIYLPRLSSQSGSEYNSYLQRATFFNGVSLTVTSLMGSLFRVSPEITITKKGTEETPLTPLQIKTLEPRFSPAAISKDHLSSLNFFKKVSREVLLTSRAGVLVDLPDFAQTEPTPFCVLYCAENILNWRFRDTGKELVLDQIILLENKIQVEALGITEKIVYRVLELDTVGKYRQSLYIPDPQKPLDIGAAKVTTTYPTIRGEMLTFIPFQFFGSSVNSPECNPMIMKDIMSLNNSHYRSSAELEHGRFFCGMPTYVVKGSGLSKNIGMPGADPGDPNVSPQFIVGPNNIWLLESEDDAQILEFHGSGLSYLESALEQKQTQMAAMGSKLLVQNRKSPGVPTTMLELAQMGEQATLSDIANNLDEGGSKVLNWMLHFASIDDRYTAALNMNKDFEPSEITAREMRAIESMYDRGLLSVSLIYEIFRDAGIVKSHISLEEFTKIIETRQAERKIELTEEAKRQQLTRPPNVAGGTRGAA